MNGHSLRLILIPLDERPVNTKYPEMVARMAGVDLLLPPSELRGWKRTPAKLEELERWLLNTAPTCGAALVSCDFLGYGNLINARISNDITAKVIARLSILTKLPIPVHAFSLITRVSNSDDNVEEPLYWKEWGTKFYRFSTLEHRRVSDDVLADDETATLSRLKETIPKELLADWLTRRLRNHAVNLSLCELVAKDKLSSLLLTSDDTAQWGFPTRERTWLKSWTELVPGLSSKIEMHPGADEVGTALVAKLINQSLGTTPSIYVEYAVESHKSLIAPYEDRPICETIAGQIHACGGTLASEIESADLILGVLTPSPHRKDYRLEYLEQDRTDRGPAYCNLFTRLAAWQLSGKPIILADVAYPNGADPLSMEFLFSPAADLNLGQLAAYGAWNTAGNTLGVAIAQGMASQLTNGDTHRELLRKIFLAHRFLEDWAYQANVRREARAHAISLWDRQDPDPENEDEVRQLAQFIEGRLSLYLEGLQGYGIGIGIKIAAGSVRLPWNRTFEVDFELEGLIELHC